MKIRPTGHYFLKKIHYLLGLLCIILAASSCKFDDAPLSDEAQVKAYFDQVQEIEKTSKEAETKLKKESEPLYSKLFKNFSEVGPKIAELNEKELPISMEAGKKIFLIKPPERIAASHKILCELFLDSVAAMQKMDSALRTGNQDELRRLSREFTKKSEDTQAKYTESLKAAGFSSTADFDSIDTVPKQPLAWYWTALLLAIGCGFTLGLLQLAYVIIAIPAVPVWLAAFKMWELRKFVAAIMLGSVAVIFLVVLSSCIGTAIATLAEGIMWPKTQLAPWFVYTVAALTSFGLLSGNGEESERSTGAMVVSLVLSISCLAGFLYAALARGYLIGPWLWIHNRI
jgi:hypothetical protein